VQDASVSHCCTSVATVHPSPATLRTQVVLPPPPFVQPTLFGLDCPRAMFGATRQIPKITSTSETLAIVRDNKSKTRCISNSPVVVAREKTKTRYTVNPRSQVETKELTLKEAQESTRSRFRCVNDSVIFRWIRLLFMQKYTYYSLTVVVVFDSDQFIETIHRVRSESLDSCGGVSPQAAALARHKPLKTAPPRWTIVPKRTSVNFVRVTDLRTTLTSRRSPIPPTVQAGRIVALREQLRRS
jgi:hypothetical protein